jgi:hypothetical protein
VASFILPLTFAPKMPPSEVLARIQDRWREGDHDGFIAAVTSAKFDPWDEDEMYQWIATGPFTHAERANTYPDVTKHYELMHRLLEASITSANVMWYDDEVLNVWIRLLVERQYPWFVCRAWNHRTPLAISLLHEAALEHAHTSVLHKLLYQRLVSHLWDVPDFLASVSTQYHFWRAPSVKRWRREVIAQLAHYPYDNEDACKTTLHAMILAEDRARCFKRFLTDPLAGPLWTRDLVTLCLENAQPDLAQWVLQQGRVEPTVADWYDWACTVHPYHRKKEMHRDRLCMEKFRALQMLLKQFDQTMPPKQWVALFTFTQGTHTFANLLVLTHRGHELLAYVWPKVVHAVSLFLPNETLEIRHEMRRCVLHVANMTSEQEMYPVFEQATENKHQWTVFANALRWGTRTTAEWLLRRGATLEVTCFTAGHSHTTLSLACYNPDDHVLALVLERVNLVSLKQMVATGYDDIIRAVFRRTLTISAATKRLRTVLAYGPRVPSFNTVCLSAMSAEFEDPDRPTDLLPVKYEGNTVCLHPLLAVALQLPGPFPVSSLPTTLFDCPSPTCFEALLTKLLAYGAVQWCRVYVHCVKHLLHPRGIPEPYLRILESHPQFAREMRSVRDHAQRMRVVTEWSAHRATDLASFLAHARREWNWYLVPSFRATTHWRMRVRAADQDEDQDQDQDLDPTRKHSWHALLASGQFPLVADQKDPVYHRLARAYRLIRRAVRRRARTRRALDTHALRRVHWEFECFTEMERRMRVRRKGAAT